MSKTAVTVVRKNTMRPQEEETLNDSKVTPNSVITMTVPYFYRILV